MPAIPLPFVIALLLVILLARLMRRDHDGPTDRASTIFIGACLVMVTVVGLRWSFDLPAVRFVQPIVAATLPPIAWICFAGLAGTDARMPRWLWLHAIPVGVVAILSTGWQAWRPPVDIVLAAQFFGYGLALLRLGWAGPDALGAARLADAARANKAIIIAGFILIGSGLIDLSIAIDLGLNQGSACRINRRGRQSGDAGPDRLRGCHSWAKPARGCSRPEAECGRAGSGHRPLASAGDAGPGGCPCP